MERGADRVAKRVPNLKDIYKSLRKPMPPPGRTERDRRDELERKEASREIQEQERRRGRSDRPQPPDRTD